MATKPALKTMFKGKDDRKEEMREAKAVKSGKLTPAQYAKGEKMEGEKDKKGALLKRASDMKAGKLSPSAYAKKEKK